MRIAQQELTLSTHHAVCGLIRSVFTFFNPEESARLLFFPYKTIVLRLQDSYTMSFKNLYLNFPTMGFMTATAAVVFNPSLYYSPPLPHREGLLHQGVKGASYFRIAAFLVAILVSSPPSQAICQSHTQSMAQFSRLGTLFPAPPAPPWPPPPPWFPPLSAGPIDAALYYSATGRQQVPFLTEDDNDKGAAHAFSPSWSATSTARPIDFDMMNIPHGRRVHHDVLAGLMSKDEPYQSHDTWRISPYCPMQTSFCSSNVSFRGRRASF